MKRITTKTILLLFGFALLPAGIQPAFGQPFTMGWHTIDSGGGSSASGGFELSGTIGQHDARGLMTGGGFSLTGGFWAAQGGKQEPVETVADSFTTFRGFHVSGELEDTFASDDSYLKHNPGITLFPNEAPVWLIFDGTLPSDDPSSLSITLEASVDTVGLSQTIEMFNWSSGAYEEIDTRSAALNTDSVVTIDVSADVVDYVQAGSGAVRNRFGWRKTGLTFLFPWTVCTDQVIWTSQ
jgi:hypothetical protein